MPYIWMLRDSLIDYNHITICLNSMSQLSVFFLSIRGLMVPDIQIKYDNARPLDFCMASHISIHTLYSLCFWSHTLMFSFWHPDHPSSLGSLIQGRQTQSLGRIERKANPLQGLVSQYSGKCGQ